jgi:hypothetical protein
LSLEDAEQKAKEYLQDKEGATEIKILEARPHEDHFLVGGWFVDKGGQKYSFELLEPRPDAAATVRSAVRDAAGTHRDTCYTTKCVTPSGLCRGLRSRLVPLHNGQNRRHSDSRAD